MVVGGWKEASLNVTQPFFSPASQHAFTAANRMIPFFCVSGVCVGGITSGDS